MLAIARAFRLSPKWVACFQAVRSEESTHAEPLASRLMKKSLQRKLLPQDMQDAVSEFLELGKVITLQPNGIAHCILPPCAQDRLVLS